MAETANLAWLSVAELSNSYRSGALTPVDVVEAALARMETLEPQLNAFIAPMRAEARAAAVAAMREMAEGHDRGVLHGIPVAIKDLIDVAGVPMTYATRSVPPVTPKRDARLVGRLRDAGAIILGKTNLLEFAYGSVNPAFGQTNNPHDVGRTSGGSSGGSAAAVAAGIVPLAIGTDTGGSIRIPAAYCGIVGMKPSFGLVPTDGVFPLSWSLDHVGPLARTVADAAALLAGLTGEAYPIGAGACRPLRIGVISALCDSPVNSDGVRAAINAAVQGLRAAGADIRMVAIPELAAANDAVVSILRPEATVIHDVLAAPDRGGYAEVTRAQIEAGRSVSATEFVLAWRLRERLTETIERLFDSVDLLLSPSVAWIAPDADPEMTDESGHDEMLSSGFANLTGHPAISLPCGLSDGLPVGLQLVAARGRDAELLVHAAAIEALLPPAVRPDFHAIGLWAGHQD